MTYQVRSIADLIGTGGRTGKQDSLAASLNTLEQDGWTLVSIMPQAKGSGNDVSPEWFIFHKAEKRVGQAAAFQ